MEPQESAAEKQQCADLLPKKTLQMETEETKRYNEFDHVFTFINSFGLYQHFVYWSVSFLKVPMALQFGFLIFAFGTQKFQCDTANVTCPITKCCVNCTSYSFDQSFVSLVSEWHLICDRAHITAFIQSSFFWGMLFGSIVGGWLSDRFGRKKCIFGNLLVMSIVSLGSAFANSVIALCILRFCVGFSQIAAMVSHYALLVELVGPDKRTFAAMATTLLWKLGGAVVVIFAYIFPYWRHMVIAGSIPGFLFLPFYKILPDSPRWLVAQGRLDEAHAILVKFGAKDKKPVDQKLLRITLERVREVQLTQQKLRKTYHIIDMFRTPRIRRFSFIICYNWFVVAMLFFSMFIFVSQLFGNIFINSVIMNIADIPTIFLSWFCAAKFGRRIPYFAGMSLAAISLIALPFIPKDLPELSTTFALLGKCLMGAEFSLIYMITSELFPTVVRNISLGTGSMSARVGAILAPFFVMMVQLPGVTMVVPLCIFGGLAFIAAFLALLLPETLFTNMQQTIEGAEKVELDYSIPFCGKKATRLEVEFPDEQGNDVEIKTTLI